MLRAPRHGEPLPAVDERLIMPEAGFEIVGGKLLAAPPADEPHGATHFDLAAILGAYVTPEFRGAVDMLTRTSKTSDHAPDASIYPRERDPETGGRKLEHLAFEIISEQARSVPAVRAKKYIARGVRRVFCIDVVKKVVLEWSPSRGDGEELPPRGTIEDACLVRPLPVRALVDAALVDDAVAQGLLAKKNRVIEEALERAHAQGTAAGVAEGKAAGIAEGKAAGIAEGKAAGVAEGKAAGIAEGKAAGVAEGKAAALLQVMALRGLVVGDEDRARVLACKDVAKLDRWLARAVAATHVRDVLRPRRK